MAIEKPIIDAPAVTRGQVKTVIGVLTDTIPPAAAILSVNGKLEIITQEPDFEGQMAFMESEDGLSVAPYIVVAIYDLPPLTGSSLEWRRIFSAGIITDPRTGEPKDPLYDLY